MLVALKQFDIKKVWRIVKEIRKSFLSKNKEDLYCSPPDLLKSDDIKDILNNLEEKLKLKLTIPIKIIKHETLLLSAEIFIYISYCPPTKFYKFIGNLIESTFPKNILLALASIMKTSQNAAKRSSTKIFKKAMAIFKLSNYKVIDAITKEDGCNDTKSQNETVKILGVFHSFIII